MPAKTTMTWSTRLLFLVMSLATALPAFGQARLHCGGGGQPSVRLVNLPPPGAGPERLETISGEVGGVNQAEAKVVIFALAEGVWYVQPYVAAPYTDIDSNCEFETNIHLGVRYAALLVRSSYQPFATIGALPSVGGDVLAVTEGPAAREDNSGRAHVAAISWLAELWRLLVGVLILLSLVAVSKKTESFVSSVEAFLSKTFAGGDKMFESWLRNCAVWLRKSGKRITDGQSDESHEADFQPSDNPLFVLLGLICLVIAGAAAYGDYVILDQSLSIFWPISNTAWAIAANLVALKALVGICLHLFRGRNGRQVRRLLNTLLVLLLVCEFAIAYSRVIEVEAATKVNQTAVPAGNEQGSLTISDSDVTAGDSATTPVDSPQSVTASLPGPKKEEGQKDYYSLYAVLSGLVALVLALSETIGIRASVHFAGIALVWIPASILLSPLGVAFCVFRFLNRSGIVGLIGVVLTVSLDILSTLATLVEKVARIALQGVKRATAWLRGLSARLTNGYREWLKNRRRHRSELIVLDSELAGSEVDAAAHWHQHDRMTRKWHAAVEEIFDDLLTELKNSMRQVNERLAVDVAQTAASKMGQKAESITEQISSAVGEVYVKTGQALPAIDGHRANQQSPRRDERHGSRQNSGGLNEERTVSQYADTLLRNRLQRESNYRARPCPDVYYCSACTCQRENFSR